MSLQSSDRFYTNGNIIPVFNNQNQIYDKTMKFCQELNIGYEDIIRLQKQVSFLKSKWQVTQNLTLSDLDDTLLSRIPQLQEDKFALARWHAGNEVVKWMWLKNFINKYYSPDLVVKQISQMTDIILTAWEVANQEAKIQRTNLSDLDTIVVPRHSLKPKELLYHILFRLQKIPKTITFFDDRVEELFDQLILISEFLENSIIAHKVELNPDYPNQIKTIDTKIFTSWEEYSSN